MTGGMRALFYILSFVMPVVGIILGIIWMNEADFEKKQVGKTCLIIAIVAMVLFCVCWFAASALSLMPSFMYYY